MQEEKVLFCRIVEIGARCVLFEQFRLRGCRTTIVPREALLALITVESGVILDEVLRVWVHLGCLHLTDIAQGLPTELSVLQRKGLHSLDHDQVGR